METKNILDIFQGTENYLAPHISNAKIEKPEYRARPVRCRLGAREPHSSCAGRTLAAGGVGSGAGECASCGGGGIGWQPGGQWWSSGDVTRLGIFLKTEVTTLADCT